MTAQTLLTAFLVLVLLQLAWELSLVLINLRHVRRTAGRVPAYFRVLWARKHEEPPEEHYAASVAYTQARAAISLCAHVLFTALTLVVVLSGVLGALSVRVGRWMARPLWAGVVYVQILALAFRLAGLPLAAWSHFGVERRFGFNRMGPGLWLADVAKGLALTAGLLALVCIPLILLMEHAGEAWWVIAAAAVILIQLAISVLHPRLIAPLFNRFTPLADGSLRQRVLDLARRLGYGVRGIDVMDSSRRSRHTNAYFSGLGRTKRVVFYDTLLERLGQEETLAVLAHEIGHDRLGHLWKGLLLSSLGVFLGLWILSRFAGQPPFYAAFGVAAPSPAAALVILSLWSGPLTFVLQPLGSLWSRRNEYAADRFARGALGAGAPLVSALFQLAADNLSNLNPHPLYSFYHYTHPTLAERVEALEALDRPAGA